LLSLITLIFYFSSDKLALVGEAIRLEYTQYVSKDNFADNLTSDRISSIAESLGLFMKYPIFGADYQIDVIASDPSLALDCKIRSFFNLALILTLIFSFYRYFKDFIKIGVNCNSCRSSYVVWRA